MGLITSPQHTAGRKGLIHIHKHIHTDLHSIVKMSGYFWQGEVTALQSVDEETDSHVRADLVTTSLCLVCQVFIFSRSEVTPGEYECWGHFAEPWGLKAYVTWMTVAVFLLPALIITICQVIFVILTGLLQHSTAHREPMITCSRQHYPIMMHVT